jgi:hypothetical protein
MKQPNEDDVWLWMEKKRNTVYGPGACQFWGTRVRPIRDDGFDLWVGEWLASKPDGFVRAFLGRWDSSKYTPDWLGFRQHEYAKRACALVKVR